MLEALTINDLYGDVTYTLTLLAAPFRKQTSWRPNATLRSVFSSVMQGVKYILCRMERIVRSGFTRFTLCNMEGWDLWCNSVWGEWRGGKVRKELDEINVEVTLGFGFYKGNKHLQKVQTIRNKKSVSFLFHQSHIQRSSLLIIRCVCSYNS